MKTKILVYLSNIAYMYFRVSLDLVHLPIRRSNVSLSLGVKQNKYCSTKKEAFLVVFSLPERRI